MAKSRIKRFLQKKSPKSFCRKKNRVTWDGELDGTTYFLSTQGKNPSISDMFKQLFEQLYPDGEKFLSCIKEYKSGGTLNTFVLDAHLAGLGFISAKTSADFIVRETIMHELDRALKERAHRIDVTSVRIDGRHEGDDFVIQLSFRNLSTANEQGGQLSEIE